MFPLLYNRIAAYVNLKFFAVLLLIQSKNYNVEKEGIIRVFIEF